jgi:hypothetical protein
VDFSRRHEEIAEIEIPVETTGVMKRAHCTGRKPEHLFFGGPWRYPADYPAAQIASSGKVASENPSSEETARAPSTIKGHYLRRRDAP